jgi:hypothetical protein
MNVCFGPDLDMPRLLLLQKCKPEHRRIGADFIQLQLRTIVPFTQSSR